MLLWPSYHWDNVAIKEFGHTKSISFAQHCYLSRQISHNYHKQANPYSLRQSIIMYNCYICWLTIISFYSQSLDEQVEQHEKYKALVEKGVSFCCKNAHCINILNSPHLLWQHPVCINVLLQACIEGNLCICD